MQKIDLKRQTEDPARCLGRKKKEQNKLIVNEIKKNAQRKYGNVKATIMVRKQSKKKYK